MKIIYLTFLFLLSFISVSLGNTENKLFFSEKSGPWIINGEVKKNFSPICVINKQWEMFQVKSIYFEMRIIRDLADNENYIVLHNTEWKIKDKLGFNDNYILKLHFFKKDKNYKTYEAYYELSDINIIRIRKFDINFYKYFMDSDLILFEMPGNIQNVLVSLEGSTEATKKFVICISIWDIIKNK